MIEIVIQKAKETWEFVKFLSEHFVEDSCQTTAAALTYQTLFAVVPALTVMYTVLSAFDSFGGMGRTVEDFIFTNIVPENVAVVQDYLRSFSEQAQNLSIVSLVFLTHSDSSLFPELTRTGVAMQTWSMPVAVLLTLPSYNERGRPHPRVLAGEVAAGAA